MKLIIFLLTGTFLSVSAKVLSQNVTFSGENVPLEKVFKEVKRQTRFSVIYTENFLSGARPVTVRAVDLPLEKFLSVLLEDQPIEYTIRSKTILLSRKASGPTADSSDQRLFLPPGAITGIVRDTTGQALEGITVTVRGTDRSTTTDAAGRYVIAADKGDVLVFSSVNTETFSVTVKEGSVISVSLHAKVSLLNKATIVYSNGYQRIPKERATGSFEFVDNNKLNEQVGTNILKRLDGTVTGLLFDSRLNGAFSGGFTIRGFSTLMGDRSPLIILDNFPYTGDINNINPNDIASVTILKDAAAASIWGARAGNGVVVLTSKKGAYEKPLQVSFNANIITAGKPDLYALPQISSADVVEVQKMLFDNNFYTGNENSPQHPALPPVVEILIAKRDGRISSEEADRQLNALKQHDLRSDYLKYIYHPGLSQQYALNVSGGNTNSNYYLSGGYDRELGKLRDLSQRVTLSSVFNFKITKKMDLGLGLNYASNKSGGGAADYSLTNGAYPYSSLADEKGRRIPMANIYRQSFVDTAGGGKLLDWNYYPLDDWKHVIATTASTSLQFTASVQYKIFKGLEFSANYSFQHQFGENLLLSDSASFYTRNLVNSYTQINNSTGEVTHIVPAGGILNVSNNDIDIHNARGQLSFNNSWGKHSVSVIAGSDIMQNKTNSQNYYTIYGYQDDPNSYAVVDYKNRYPDYVTGNMNTIPGAPARFPYSLNRFISYFGNASYSYNDRYIFSVSARRDASNLFGVKTNDRWKPLWSAGVVWNISKEPFYQSEVLPVLSFHSTYGFAGNINNSYVAKTVIGYSPVDPITFLPNTYITQYGNPELRWEKAATLNFRMDFGFVRNVVSGHAEYFLKSDKDLYGPVPVDRTTGIISRSLTKNAASLKGQGFELQLDFRNIDRAFKWSTGFSVSYVDSRVAKYNLDRTYNSQYIGAGVINPVEGKPVSQIITYKWNGLDPANGDPVGMLNGKPSKDYYSIFTDTSLNDLQFHGSSFPLISGFINNTFSFKGFFVTVNLVYKLKYEFLRPSIRYSDLFTKGNGHSDFGKRWRSPGDERMTNIPSMVYPSLYGRDDFYSWSSALVTKGDQLRLQYINMGYNFSPGKLIKAKLKDFQVWLNISNLGIIWKANKYGIDPDNIAAVPPPKAFAIGIKASF
jgi:TonB-linked SusC/RagA family outer membrane protein